MSTEHDKPRTISGVDEPEHSERLLDAMRQVRSQLDAGQMPDRDALLAEYSDVAEELACCLDSLDFVSQVAPQLRRPKIIGPFCLTICVNPSHDICPTISRLPRPF